MAPAPQARCHAHSLLLQPVLLICCGSLVCTRLPLSDFRAWWESHSRGNLEKGQRRHRKRAGGRQQTCGLAWSPDLAGAAEVPWAGRAQF